jgi:hypothetical protein
VVLIGGWLPDFVRLGEPEPHLGERVIEKLVAAGLRACGCRGCGGTG